MSDTLRGLIVFVSALVTIALWAPLRNFPQALADGRVVSETYFGMFTYLTLRTELKEPDYTMTWTPHRAPLLTTAAVTLVLWSGVIVVVRKKKGSAADRTESQ